MKFKSPTNADIYVATTGGICAQVGPEWRDLPAGLHKAAIMAGCVSDNMDPDVINPPAPVLSSAEFDRAAVVSNSIKTLLEADGVEGFTAEGVPDLVAVSKLSGFEVDRGEMLKAWNELNKAVDIGATEVADHSLPGEEVPAPKAKPKKAIA
jgi:hypothetical protein